MSHTGDLFRASIARVRSLPRAVLFAAGLLLLAGVAVAGVFAYRTWDYVEHDNDFCMSCHLMQDPFDRFAESEHRGLGCKACHKPTFVGRSRMALTQVIENPEEIEEHAEVPNEKCVSCHVDGDPDQWTLISRSVGHRVHLESEDTSLSGLRCVECHSTGVHEFAATSRTCAQAGCHENVDIKLGRMGDFTIHCVACHDFSRPAPEPAVIATGASGARASTTVAPLRPQASECLSCHAMRLLVGDLADDEPHDAVCGACHNPHEQTTPADAVQSCAVAGCHASADTITPMHRGLPAGRLETCTLCHSPHDAHIGDVQCVACHATGARIDRGVTTLPRGVGQEVRRFAATRVLPRATDAEGLQFDHQRHGAVECSNCHVSREAHGEVTATSLRECRECHHSPANAARVQCTRCHQAQRTSTAVQHVNTSMNVATAGRSRRMPFVHGQHTSVVCTRCHTEGPELSAASVDCASCHTQHHRPDAVCRSCHLEAPEGAHRLVVHTGCAGSGCHAALPFQDRPETREFCLTCHQDMVTHETGRVCSACHAMPAWRRTVSR